MKNTINNTLWTNGFICGLVCGEGNFTIAITKSNSCKIGYHIRPYFQIELSIKDELLMKMVKDFFGIGSIYYPKPRTRHIKESPTCRYAVTSITDCEKIANFFTENPLIGIKNNAFEIWKKCLDIIINGEHTTSDGFKKIALLRNDINQIRRPSTYKEYELLKEFIKPNLNKRNVSKWTEQEMILCNNYFNGKITRQQLIDITKRTPASIDNKIKRIKYQKGK